MKWHIGTDGKPEAVENPTARENADLVTVRCLIYRDFDGGPDKGWIYGVLDDSLESVELHFYGNKSKDPEFRILVHAHSFNALCEMLQSMALKSKGIR